VGAGVRVSVGVGEGVFVGVLVGVFVGVAVGVGVGVDVGVAVGDGVRVGVDVDVAVGVGGGIGIRIEARASSIAPRRIMIRKIPVTNAMRGGILSPHGRPGRAADRAAGVYRNMGILARVAWCELRELRVRN
jgi:hypothetical protein